MEFSSVRNNLACCALIFFLLLEETHGKKASELELGLKSNVRKIFPTNHKKSGKSGLKYCGAQAIPPMKELVCTDFCEGGQCRNFYCECPSDEALKESCVQADEASRCAGICRGFDFSVSYHCPKRELLPPCEARHCRVEKGEFHCFCA